MNFQYLHDIYLPVRDLERMVAWYVKQFGLVVTEKFRNEKGSAVRLSFQNTSFILVACGEPFKGCGNKNIKGEDSDE